VRALTAGEVEAYRRDGFVVLRDFLQPDELAEWRKAAEAAVERRAERRLPRPGTDYDEFFHHEDDYYNSVFDQRINLWMTDEAIAELVCSAELGSRAAELAGVDGVRIWLDQALVKQPYSPPTSYHLDNPYWSFSSHDAITIWLALDDATMANGCLCYLPGTHREARFDNVSIGPEIGALFDVYPNWRDIEPVFCPVPAGSAVAHNGLVAHGATANMTPHRRFAMTVAYMPNGATYNGKQDILTSEQVARLKVGDPLDDDRQNPLVYSRSAVVRSGEA
jgi:phytanoyl-CoA hydroxylase